MSQRTGTVIVAVGDEILGGFTLDTNSHWLAARVREAGYPVVRIEVVGDDAAAVAAAVRRAVDDPEAARILVCGGLGPTPDDRTAPGVAEALGRPLEVDPAAMGHIAGIVARMHAAGWVESAEVGEAHGKMAVIPAGGLVLENRRGMAPPAAYPVPRAGNGDDDRWLFILPGVPRELQVIVSEEVIPRFFARGLPVHVAEARHRDVVEADFYGAMRAVETEFPDVSVGSYPQSDRRELIIRARGADAKRVAAALRRVAEVHAQRRG